MKLSDIFPQNGENGTITRGNRGKTEGYSCAEVARIIGRHSNTVRKYETWGFIGPVPRGPNGYRRYSRAHVLQALFSVTALRTCFQEWQGRRRMKAMIAFMLANRFDEVRVGLAEHRSALEKALEGAVEARGILEKWNARQKAEGNGPKAGTRGRPKHEENPETTEAKARTYRSEAARLIGVSGDTLRDWERNGLVSPARLPNGRRTYAQRDLEKLRVIRVLRQADYSLMGLVNLFGEKTAMEDLTFARDRWDETLRSLIEDCDLLGEITDELERGAKGK